MLRKILLTLGVASFTIMTCSNVQADTPSANTAVTSVNSATFSPEQKKQINEMIHDYLLKNPQILINMSQELQKKQEFMFKEKSQSVVHKDAREIFSSSTSPVVGNKNGNITLVEFFDYQCPHCKEMVGPINSLITDNKNLRVVYKEFPIFPGSTNIAAAALAAANQGKYKEFHDALMAANNPISQQDVMNIAKQVGLNLDQLKNDMNSKAVNSEIKANMALAMKLGFPGTPAFIIATNINDPSKLYSTVIPGGLPPEALQNVIQQVAAHSTK